MGISLRRRILSRTMRVTLAWKHTNTAVNNNDEQMCKNRLPSMEKMRRSYLEVGDQSVHRRPFVRTGVYHLR